MTAKADEQKTRKALTGSNSGMTYSRQAEIDQGLEPIQEVRIQEQRVGLVNRRSMMRIIARRINAAADRA
jgi:hypothetical protein